MTCREARLALYPTLETAATTVERVAASQHVTQCSECRQYFQNQVELGRGLRSALPHTQASEALRQRVGATVEQRRQRSSNTPLWRRVGLFWPAAALILLVPVFSWFLARTSSRSFFNEMCADHSRYLQAQSQIRAERAGTIQTWLQQKTQFRVHVPQSPDTQLLGARLCFLKKRKAALIFFRKNGHPVSLFELDASEVSLLALHRSVIDAKDVWLDSMDGYSLVAIRQRGVVSVLVSDLAESDLLALASSFRSDS